MIKYYLAPLEGITGYIFRNAIAQFFGEGINKYYTPFLTPHIKRDFSSKELNEISCENNANVNLVPQILTNNAEDFVRLAAHLHEMGYEEVNLNLGCPSRTVASKGRGAGALGDLDLLKRFLDEIFDSGDKNISIKTRIGISDYNEYYDLFKIYSEYPIKELIIHPRVMKEMYQGIPHQEAFIDALTMFDFPVCYNGDIVDGNSLNRLKVNITNRLNSFTSELIVSDEKVVDSVEDEDLPYNFSAVMIGRGILKNPSLIREYNGGDKASNEEIKRFLSKLLEDYRVEFSGKPPVLFKMKEIWSYLSSNYPEKEKECKKLLKCKSIEEYQIYVNQILEC